MGLSRTKLLAALRQLHQERRRRLRRLTREHPLAIGTVTQVHRKCGRPHCHCLTGLGHPQVLFLFKDPRQGRRRCKLVRRADESRLREAGQRYRDFRMDLQRLRAIDREEKRILVALGETRAIHYE